MTDTQLTPHEAEASGYDLADVAVTRTEAVELSKQDVDFLSSLAMPDVWEFGWPETFRVMFSWVTHKLTLVRDFSRLAIGYPRGFGKTTFAKILVLYIILFTDRRFVLILGKTKPLAENIISDVMDMLQEPNIVAVFGDYRTGLLKDRADLKQFAFRGRTIIIGGLGEGGTVRGLNLKNERPDFILFDDIQSREDADSEVVSDNLYSWMVGTAMKAKSPKGCLYLFLGNMYPTEHSILKKLIADKYWETFVAGGILVDPDTGELSSLWEDLQPLKQLLLEYAQDLSAGKPEIFMSEVLNDGNASINTDISTSDILPNPFHDDEIHQGNFIIIDPATGKANADDVSIGYFQLFDATPVLWDLTYGVMSPGDTIREALRLAQLYDCKLILVEGTAYQSTLAYWFGVIMQQLGVEGVQVAEIYPRGGSKNARILRMFPQLTQGELMLHTRVRAAVISQITNYNKLRVNNTDGILDLLCYAPRVPLEFEDLLRSHTVIDVQAREIDAYEAEAQGSNHAPF